MVTAFSYVCTLYTYIIAKQHALFETAWIGRLKVHTYVPLIVLVHSYGLYRYLQGDRYV